MKKQYVNFVSILLVTLCLAFTACNQGMLAGGETGTVRVVIGGGLQPVQLIPPTDCRFLTIPIRKSPLRMRTVINWHKVQRRLH